MLYATDLNDAQWSAISDLIIRKKRRGPKSRVDLRNVVNAIFYRLRTGCQWRLLPKEFENFSIVSGYWRRWNESGLWEKLNTRLREKIREKEGRKTTPTAAIIDSQSVKTVQKGGSAAMMQASKPKVASGILR
jgi:putative transposase